MRLLLFTGKGGAGTTTLAAAGAVHAARCGIKTLLLGVDDDGALAEVLTEEAAAESALTVQSTPGFPAAQAQDAVRAVLDQAGVDPVPADLIGVLPGAEEVSVLLAVRDAVVQGPWDLVICDLGPTRSALRLLALPEALDHYLERMLGVGRRVQRAMSLPVDPLVAGADRLAAELAGVRELFAAPSTSVRLVTAPGAVGLAHARRALPRLALYGLVVDAVLVNGVRRAGPEPARPAEQVELAELAGVVPVLTLPHLDTEPAGPQALPALEALGALLQDPATLLDPVGASAVGGAAVISRHGEEFELELSLPLARREELDLHRLGDDLVIRLGRDRRVLTLRSGLRRCRVIGARLDGPVLRVRFEPDPALWRS